MLKIHILYFKFEFRTTTFTFLLHAWRNCLSKWSHIRTCSKFWIVIWTWPNAFVSLTVRNGLWSLFLGFTILVILRLLLFVLIPCWTCYINLLFGWVNFITYIIKLDVFTTSMLWATKLMRRWICTFEQRKLIIGILIYI